MANPNLRDGANRKWKEFSRYKHGVVEGRAQTQAISEDERRHPDDLEPPPQKPIFANKAPSPSKPIPDNPPVATVYDRFHKWGSTYVTVANLHFSGDDPIPDPGAYHTITAGYAFAKTLADRRVGDERVVVWVSGGYYPEDITFDDPRIDVVGIGRPTIEGIVTITADCTRILFDFFEIINPTAGEDDDPRDFAGIILEPGAESGTHFSDIQLKRLYCHGNKTQVFFQRWVDIDDCDFQSEDNLSTGIPSVDFQFVITDGISIPSKWSQIRNSRLNGQPFPGGMLAPTYFRKGYALRIIVSNDLMGIPYSNAVTRSTGVYLKNCVISGWSSNYYWNLIHDNCRHIEGDMLNSTSGSIHHYCRCWSGEGFGPSANTWFNHSMFTVRYCACIIDDGVIPNSWASSNVYLHHIVHNGADHASPPLLAGSDVIDGTNLVPPQPKPIGFVLASSYATPAPFVYGAAGIENAVIAMVTTGAINFFTDFWEDT